MGRKRVKIFKSNVEARDILRERGVWNRVDIDRTFRTLASAKKHAKPPQFVICHDDGRGFSVAELAPERKD